MHNFKQADLQFHTAKEKERRWRMIRQNAKYWAVYLDLTAIERVTKKIYVGKQIIKLTIVDDAYLLLKGAVSCGDNTSPAGSSGESQCR